MHSEKYYLKSSPVSHSILTFVSVPGQFVSRALQIPICVLFCTWSERVSNFEVRMRTGQPLLSDTVRNRCLKLSYLVTWPRISLKIIPHDSCALQACISPTPRNWRRRPGRPRHAKWLRTVVEDLRQFNLDSRQGSREQLGGDSQEQQCHRQAPIEFYISLLNC